MILNGSVGWACLNLFIERGKLGTLPRSVTMRVGTKHWLALLHSCLETQAINLLILWRVGGQLDGIH